MTPQPFKAILLKLAAVVLFVVMAALVKAASGRVPPGEAVFFRSFFAIPVILGALTIRGKLHGGLKVVEPLGHLWRGLIGTCAMGLAFTGLALLPQGTFRIAEPQDDGTVWPAAITIDRDRFTVDLREAPAQATGPHNTSRDGAVIVCQMLFKALTDPERFANAGSFAPLKVLTRPGTIFHAGPTAPQGYYFETRIRLFDLLWQCLARALPGRLPAGHFGSIFGTVIAGVHPDTGRRFTMVEPQMGGWGATARRPGMDAMFSTSHGDTFNCPAEIAEARYGYVVEEKALGDRPDVEGVHPGGRGVRLRYRMRGDATLSVGLSHGTVPVWSVGPEETGGLNRLAVLRRDGTSVTPAFASGVALAAGDEVRIETASGGAHTPIDQRTRPVAPVGAAASGGSPGSDAGPIGPLHECNDRD